jgi:stearoyl-CoA desaturase (delta-9 desaturase)
MCGVEIGNHRLLSHRAFKTGFWGKRILILAGAMSLQDSPISWASMHRVHHRACEQELDPHSPIYDGRGFSFAQASWLSLPRRHVPKVCPSRIEDLLDADDMLMASRLNPPMVWGCFVIISIIIALCAKFRYKQYRRSKFQPVILAVYYLSFYAALPVFLTFHMIGLVNSWTHLWGERPFLDAMMAHEYTCESRNVAWLLPFLMGTNWHNNHHAAPSSASNWVRWYQLDFFYLVLRAMEAIGLVWDLRIEVPETERPGYEASFFEPTKMMLSSGVAAILLWKLWPRATTAAKPWSMFLTKTQ